MQQALEAFFIIAVSIVFYKKLKCHHAFIEFTPVGFPTGVLVDIYQFIDEYRVNP